MKTEKRAGTVRELVPLLFVDNVQQSVDFYTTRLGFELKQTWEPDGELAWCRLERDRCAVMLQQATSEEDGVSGSRGKGVGFFFICDDAESVHSDFVRRGLALAAPEAAFYGMKQVFVKDPDGYELCFESPVEG
jgi:catechol 2,3-dioxygenase-like lactoylglutathione lyase family enzyme